MAFVVDAFAVIGVVVVAAVVWLFASAPARKRRWAREDAANAMMGEARAAFHRAMYKGMETSQFSARNQ